MIIGVGIDVVDVQRFATSLARTPTMAARLFVAHEQLTPSGTPRTTESLAARFAAKEALAKALGTEGGLVWTDAEVHIDEAGRPSLVITGSVQDRATQVGAARFHVSLSHDGGIATAIVIAEG